MSLTTHLFAKRLLGLFAAHHAFGESAFGSFFFNFGRSINLLFHGLFLSVHLSASLVEFFFK